MKGTQSKEDRGNKFLSYFDAFLDNKTIAAVTPSSKFLVSRVVKAMDLGDAKTVIEYGAAAGVMTRRILELLPKDGTLIAIEFDEKLFESLRKLEDPRLKICHGDVRDIDKIVHRFGIKQVDAIASGIPFAFLSAAERRELLSKTSAILRPGGRFVTYQITIHLMPLLKGYFKRMKMEWEIRNLPPHFVFTAFK